MKVPCSISIVVFMLLSVGVLAQNATKKKPRPNIVLIFVDDWAWNGSPVPMDASMPNSQMPVLQMPNLEKLTSEGMKFRNAYAGAPQCSPSRATTACAVKNPLWPFHCGEEWHSLPFRFTIIAPERVDDRLSEPNKRVTLAGLPIHASEKTS